MPTQELQGRPSERSRNTVPENTEVRDWPHAAIVDTLFPAFKPPRQAVDLSAYSISKEEEEDGKKQANPLVPYTPPSSPSQEE